MNSPACRRRSGRPSRHIVAGAGIRLHPDPLHLMLRWLLAWRTGCRGETAVLLLLYLCYSFDNLPARWAVAPLLVNYHRDCPNRAALASRPPGLIPPALPVVRQAPTLL